MKGFPILLTLCAHAVGIHLGSGSSAPDFSSVTAAEEARRAAVTGLNTARGGLATAQAAAAGSRTTLATTHTTLEQKLKDEKMYAQRYADNADAGWGSHLVNTRAAIETLQANKGTQADAVATADAAEGTANAGVATAEEALADAKDDLATKLASFMTAGAGLVDEFSALQHEHHKLVADKAAAEDASEVRRSDLARQLDNEIDPAARGDLEAAETARAAKLTSDSSTYDSEIAANQAAIDGMKANVAAFHLNANNAKKTDAAGNMPFDAAHDPLLEYCVGAAADNYVRFVAARDKVNGAGAGCVRVHQSGSTKNDDEVYFTTADASNGGPCNGCESLNPQTA